MSTAVIWRVRISAGDEVFVEFVTDDLVSFSSDADIQNDLKMSSALSPI